MALQKNKIYRMEFTGYTTEGAAVGHVQGMAVFVQGGAVGDQCDVKIIKVGKRLAFGRIEKIIIPSKHRIIPLCPHAGKCGGCCYQHISYEQELEAKKQKVQDALTRIGGFSDLQIEITGAEHTTYYRNKAQFPVGQKEGIPYTGFYRPRSHDIVPAKTCYIVKPIANELAAAVCDWMQQYRIPAYDEILKTGLIRHIYVRNGEKSGEVQLCLITAKANLPYKQELIAKLTKQFPALTSIVQNINRRTDNVILGDKMVTLWGHDMLQDSLCGNVFQLSPYAFYQVNHAQTEKLYAYALEFAQLDGSQQVIDLYCGAGTITLALASHAKSVIGVEIIPEAIQNAKENAQRNDVQNVEFLCADAGQAAMMFAQRGQKPDVLCVDPPRKGLSEQAVQAIVEMQPKRVVYVSCDPATLARDCKMLCMEGYTLEQAHAVDLFPRTNHVETVCLLSKLQTKQHIEVDLNLDELDLTSAESKATYDEIKAYIIDKFGLKVSSLYIAQIKDKYGLKEHENYNKAKSENNRVPNCPPEKEAAIVEALKHFKMI